MPQRLTGEPSVISFPTTHHPDAHERELRTQQLLEEAAHADPDRRQQLWDDVVVLNREIALGVAHRYHRPGMEMEDLEQVALLGLTKAARRYRPGPRPSFSAYAFPTVAGEVKRYFRDSTWSVRPPRALQEAVLAVRAAQSDLAQQLGHAPTRAEPAGAEWTPRWSTRARGGGELLGAVAGRTGHGADEGTIGETIADPATSSTRSTRARRCTAPSGR